MKDETLRLIRDVGSSGAFSAQIQGEATRLFMEQLTVDERVSEYELKGQWDNYIAQLERRKTELAVECVILESKVESLEVKFDGIKEAMDEDCLKIVELDDKEKKYSVEKRMGLAAEIAVHLLKKFGVV